jgi:exosortase/archaeosortase family protein
MALVITGVIAVEIFLKNWYNKLLMLLLILPLSLLKNAIRIATITMLAQYVDISFLTHSTLHQRCGFVFYIIALAIYFPLMIWISRLETKHSSKTASDKIIG